MSRDPQLQIIKEILISVETRNPDDDFLLAFVRPSCLQTYESPLCFISNPEILLRLSL